MPRHFKHWLKAYCEFTAVSEAPLEFHFWTGVSTLAATLKRRVWRDELQFKWTPNFYIIFVGPAGVVTKSTTLNIGYQILRNVKDDQGREIVHFGPDSMTWHGLAKRFEMASAYETYTDRSGNQQRILMSPLTCSVSELGTFLRPDDKGLVSFLTDVWDGKDRPFGHYTKDSGNLNIENPWLNVIGATTPEWMQNNFPVSLLNEGLGARTIFIYGDKKRHYTAYPSRQVKATNYHDQETKLVEDLQYIAKLGGPIDMTEEAFKWGEAWYKKHLEGRELHMASSRYSGYLARKQTHMHKLAIILSLAQRDDLLITKDDLEQANEILLQAEQSMIRVFESVGVVDEAKHVAEVVAFVRAHQWIGINELYYSHCHNIMAQRDFAMAVKQAVEGQLLIYVTKDNKPGLSPRPRTTH